MTWIDVASPRPRVAIVGTGVSGLMVAHRLHATHDLTIFEANHHVGGHVNTVVVDDGGTPLAIDTGFIVFNEVTYPGFCRLLDELGVASHATTMSFSVRCDQSGIEYNGTSINGLFAQRRNLMRPSFLAMVRDILRFNREAPNVLNAADDSLTVDAYVRRQGYGRRFIDQYLRPMGASIWSCPEATFGGFSIRFVVAFFCNHRMLQVEGRPEWRVVTGGSRRYVETLVRPFRDCIRLGTAVENIARTPVGVEVNTADGVETFDHVVVAVHADEALALLGQPSTVERTLLTQFPYQANDAILHTDTRLLPKSRRAWAAWNHHVRAGGDGEVSVTYNMNMLQRFSSRRTYCVTLNETDSIDPACIIERFRYHHPVYTVGYADAHCRHDELIDHDGLSYCGAYWGYGFHEDGLRSGAKVADRLAAVGVA